MNKIPIHTLLNPSCHESSEARLARVHAQLLTIFCEICSSEELDYLEAQCRLQKILLDLNNIADGKALTEIERLTVGKIYQLSVGISDILTERGRLQKISKAFMSAHLTQGNNSTQFGNSKESLVFKVWTQDMMNDRPQNDGSYKGHRLPKKHVDVLETWYKNHSSNPYLTEDDLLELMDKTLLSRNQIKNWVSNRRRKEKTTNISSEISGLLSEK